MIVHRDKAYAVGRTLTEKLRKRIPRQQYDVPIQAAIGAERDRARDRQGISQGRDREVLRRRHQPQEKAAGEAEGGQASDEAGRAGRGASGGIPRGSRARRGVGGRRQRAVRVVRLRKMTDIEEAREPKGIPGAPDASRERSGEHAQRDHRAWRSSARCCSRCCSPFHRCARRWSASPTRACRYRRGGRLKLCLVRRLCLLLLLVFEDIGRSFVMRVALSELAVNSFVSVSGLGGIALGAWVLHSRGLEPDGHRRRRST